MRSMFSVLLALVALLLWLPGLASAAPPKSAVPPFVVAKADLSTLGADETRNVETVRRIYQDFFDGKIQGILAQLAPGLSWRVLGPGDNPLFQEYNDENVRDWFDLLRADFKYTYMHIGNFVVKGDTVIAFGTERGIGRPSGREFINNWVQVWTLKDGLVTYFLSYEDTSTLLLVLQPR